MSLDRDGQSGGYLDPEDGLGSYLKRIQEFPFLERSQELRAAAVTHAGVCLQKWKETSKRRHVWEEVYVQLFRAWEDVQTYCKINTIPSPDLLILLREGAMLPTRLSDNQPMYLEHVLGPLGWGRKEYKETNIEDNRSDLTFDQFSRPLFCMVECMFLLPAELQKRLSAYAMEHHMLPDWKHIESLFQRWVGEDLSRHEHQLQEHILGARSLLVLSNTRFAVNLAKKADQTIPLDDRIQDANIGLLKAADYFEPHRGYRFETYAGRAVLSMLWRKRNKDDQSPMQSLDAVRSADPDGKSFGDQLVYSMPSPEERAFQLAIHDILEAVLQSLPERERKLVILRHGLEGGPPYNNGQIGEIFKITRERVRQVLLEGESRVIRQIARRFPFVLPPGMTPEMALKWADDRLAKLPKNRPKNHTNDPEV